MHSKQEAHGPHRSPDSEKHFLAIKRLEQSYKYNAGWLKIDIIQPPISF